MSEFEVFLPDEVGVLDEDGNRVDVEEIKPLRDWVTRQVTVSTSSERIDDNPLADRRTVVVKALRTNSQPVYVAGSSPAQTDSGYPIYAGETFIAELDDSAAIYAVAGEGNQDVAVLEVGGSD